jgi:beta-glucosidase
MNAAVAAAQAADVVVLAVGEPSWMSGEAKSRQTLGLPGVQAQLAERIVATGKPVVTVLITGRPLVIPDLLEHSTALLIAWHGGVQTGPAIADLLTGAVEPTGRLTTSWPRALGQIPIQYNCLNPGRGFTGANSSNYIDGSRDPLLPFGTGQGYTTFTVDQVTVDHRNAPFNGKVIATATVKNTGARSGSTVVQCYIRDYAAIGGVRPVKELRGFERVTLQAGASQTVHFTLNQKSLGYWLPDGRWSLEPGWFKVWVGLDSTTQNGADFSLDK